MPNQKKITHRTYLTDGQANRQHFRDHCFEVLVDSISEKVEEVNIFYLNSSISKQKG